MLLPMNMAMLPFTKIPICPECEEDLAYLDSALIIEPEDKANQHYFTCTNEDCGVCYHVWTMFDDEDAPLFHGCYSGAYPEIIDQYDPTKGCNIG